MKNLKNLNPSDYFKILLHRKWYAITAFILTVGGCAVYTLKQPYIYKSTAMLQVEVEPIPKNYVRPSDGSTPQQYIDAVREKIQSRSFMEQLVQEFQIGGYGSTDEFVMENAVLGIRNSIETKSTSSNTFTISYLSPDAQLAQSLTMRLVDLLIQSSNIARKYKAVETDQFIDEQLRQTEQKLADQEEKIKQFKSAHFGQLPDQTNANTSALNALKARLDLVESSLEASRSRKRKLKLQTQRQLDLFAQSDLSSESILKDVEVDKGTSDLEALLSVKQKQLAELSLRYTSSYPDVVRVAKEVEDIKKRIERQSAEIEQEEKTPTEDAPTLDPGDGLLAGMESIGTDLEIEMLDDEIGKIDKERQSIINEMRLYENRLKLAPVLEQELSALMRVRESLETQYRNLQDKKFQAQMTANLETDKGNDTYKIIDEANYPEKPFSPNRKRIAIIGLGFAFTLGIGAAFGRELLDTTLSTEEETARVLNMPVLVSVYEISTKKARKSETEQLSKSA